MRISDWSSDVCSSDLLLHGMAMNGGIDHAVEVLTPLEFSAALAGFRYFGLVRIAELLESIGAFGTEVQAERLNKEYGAAVPSDSTLVHAFRLKLLASPESFSPLEEIGRASCRDRLCQYV